MCTLSGVSFNDAELIGEAAQPGPYSVGGSASFGTQTAEQLEHRWAVPVIRRDVNFSHQSDVRLMYPEDIVEFLHDELYMVRGGPNTTWEAYLTRYTHLAAASLTQPYLSATLLADAK